MDTPADKRVPDRTGEWFVPRWGPLKLRTFLGLLFLPYTGMVLSFAVIGSVLAPHLDYGRLLAIVLIYFFGLGVAGHALDALGNRGKKPWGNAFASSQLWTLAILSLGLAYAIAIYYMVRCVPLLWLIAVPEGFFLLAYNLELFAGRFHSDRWFAFSWGVLPVLAGYVMQTDRVSPPALILAAAMGLFSLLEIKASRPYKKLKGQTPDLDAGSLALLLRYETLLKCVSLGVILLGAGLLLWRATG